MLQDVITRNFIVVVIVFVVVVWLLSRSVGGGKVGSGGTDHGVDDGE